MDQLPESGSTTSCASGRQSWLALAPCSSLVVHSICFLWLVAFPSLNELRAAGLTKGAVNRGMRGSVRRSTLQDLRKTALDAGPSVCQAALSGCRRGSPAASVGDL